MPRNGSAHSLDRGTGLSSSGVHGCTPAMSVFEAQTLAPEEAPDRVPSHRDPCSSQQFPKPVDDQMRRLGDQPVNQFPVWLQEPGAVTADPARRHTLTAPNTR